MENFKGWGWHVFLVLVLFIGVFLRISGINYGLPSKAGRLSSYNPDEHPAFSAISEWGKRDFYTYNLDVARLKIRIMESKKNKDKIGQILLKKLVPIHNGGGNASAVASLEKIAVVDALNSLLNEPHLFQLLEENRLNLNKEIQELWQKAKDLAADGRALEGDELKRLNQAILLAHYPQETSGTPKWKTYKFLYFHPGGFALWGGFSLIPVAVSLKIAELAGYIQRAPRAFYAAHLSEADKLYKTGRILMVLFGICGMALVFFIARSVYGSISALIAALFFSLLPGQIVYSFSMKADAMMVCFFLVAFFFAVKNIQDYKNRYALGAGCFFGVALATKFSVFPSIVLLVLSIFLLSPSLRIKSLFLMFLFIGVSFCLATPYFVVEFPGLFLEALQFSKGRMNPPIYDIIFGHGLKSYITAYLPTAMGWPLTILGILSFLSIGARLLWRKIRGGSITGIPCGNFDLLFLLSFLFIYWITAPTRQGGTNYTLILQIFLILFSARFLGLLWTARHPIWKLASLAILVFVGGYTFSYAVATVRLYSEENVRETASRWLERNVSKGSRIAVLQNSFFLPSILRAYEPPYQLVESWDDLVVSSYKKSSFLMDMPVLMLEEAAKKCDYIVLAENEVRIYLHPKMQSYFPEQAAALKRIMDPKKEIARFEKEAKFLWMRFPKNYPPDDWLWPNSTIYIYKN